MPTNFNPFAKWLGLNPKITNPHHFQLLGVSTELTDQAKIQSAVEVGVKKKLAMLAKVPSGEHDELVQNLKQRLAIARKTLLEPKTRGDYMEKLKPQDKAQQSGKMTATTPATSSTVPAPSATPSTQAASPSSASPSPDSAPLNTKATQAASTAPQMDVAPSSLAVPAAAATAPAKSDLTLPSDGEPPAIATSAEPVASENSPLAAQPAARTDQPIPMAVSLSSTAQAVTANTNQAFSDGLAVNSDGIPIDEVRIKKKTMRRRKKFKLGWIIGAFMLVTAGVGVFLIYHNFDVLMDLGGVDPEAIPSSPGIIKETDDPPKKDDSPPSISAVRNREPDSETSSTKLPSLDLDTLPELDIDAIMKDPETAIATGRRGGEPVTEIEKPTNSDKTSTKQPTAENDTDSPPSGEIVRFDDLQLARYRRHVERARRSLFRRDKGTAIKSIELAIKILDEVRPDKAARFEGEQIPIAAIAVETKEIYDLIDGFWEQVVASCQAIPGGQEIIASGQTIAFVEADEEKVIVRHAGSNITYEYYFCPPSLAVQLAKQGAIADIPIWNKQLAAFYALNQVDGANYQAQIDKLLNISEEAGHDCAGIRHFADFEFGSIGKPAEKIRMPNRKEFRDGIEEFRNESDYTEIAKLPPGGAAMLAELLFQIDSPNFEQHVIFLEEARKLGVRSGDAAITEDAIIELDNFAKINRSKLTCDSFVQISKNELSPSQRRILMEQAIPFLKSKLAESAKLKSRQQLANELMDIATAYAMTDSARRLTQLN